MLRYALSPATVDITGASVVFTVRGKVTRAPATIVSTTPPVVEYVWQPGDTETVGLAPAEFEVTYPDGGTGTFPGPGAEPLVVNVGPDLG